MFGPLKILSGPLQIREVLQEKLIFRSSLFYWRPPLAIGLSGPTKTSRRLRQNTFNWPTQTKPTKAIGLSGMDLNADRPIYTSGTAINQPTLASSPRSSPSSSILTFPPSLSCFFSSGSWRRRRRWWPGTRERRSSAGTSRLFRGGRGQINWGGKGWTTTIIIQNINSE